MEARPLSRSEHTPSSPRHGLGRNVRRHAQISSFGNGLTNEKLRAVDGKEKFHRQGLGASSISANLLVPPGCLRRRHPTSSVSSSRTAQICLGHGSMGERSGIGNGKMFDFCASNVETRDSTEDAQRLVIV